MAQQYKIEKKKDSIIVEKIKPYITFMLNKNRVVVVKENDWFYFYTKESKTGNYKLFTQEPVIFMFAFFEILHKKSMLEIVQLMQPQEVN